MGRNIKIYIAMHKPAILPHNLEGYCPIQVGTTVKDEFLPLHDDIGDNISQKNDRYCELTALYWAWKNDIKSDYIGLCHYRRYFSFRHNIPLYSHIKKYFHQDSMHFPYERKVHINSASISHIFKTNDIILPKPFRADVTIQDQYIQGHNQHDLCVLHTILIEMYPEYERAWDIVMNGSELSLFNMFITRKNIFENYMTWLFGILFQVEKYIPPKEDAYQNRTFGFMAERLLNIYIVHNQYKVKYLHVLFVPDKYYQ